MRWDVVSWAAIALLLFAAEAMAPGAFMLWMGFAATAVFLGVLLIPGVPVLWQVVAFVALSFVSVQIYRRWFRKHEPQSDRPHLNQRANTLVGHVAPLDQPIVNGRGRVQIADAFWVVEGPELPSGTPVRVVAVDGMTLKVQQV